MTRQQFALFILALPACAATSTTSSTSAITSALPKAEWIDVQTAATTPLADEQGSPQLPATCSGGPPAMFAAMSAQVMTGANGPVQAVLGLVSTVTQSPPAVMTPDHAVWGPLTSPGDPLVHRLDLQRVAPDTVHFVLSGKPVAAGDDAWIGLFQGDIHAPDADHAEGDVEIDLGAIHTLDSNARPVAGGIAIHFASAPEGRGIDETFANIVDPAAPQPNDAHYAFAQDANGVTFDFQTLTDFDHDGTLDEHLEIQARFAPDGEGKASVTATGGSLGSANVGAIECWDNQQRVLFYGDDINANPPAGDPGCCIP